MKHNIVNGKWFPEPCTFVKVENSKIPEVIQMLRDNGQPVWELQEKEFDIEDDCIIFLYGKWNSAQKHLITLKSDPEISFPDFTALVTMKLPKSWCIQCTEEAMKHEAWGRFIHNGFNYVIGHFYGEKEEPTASNISFGDQITIETWAALNPVEEKKELNVLPDELVNQYESAIRSGLKAEISIGQEACMCAQIAVEYAEQRIGFILNYFEGIYHETDFGKGKEIAEVIRNIIQQNS